MIFSFARYHQVLFWYRPTLGRFWSQVYTMWDYKLCSFSHLLEDLLGSPTGGSFAKRCLEAHLTGGRAGWRRTGSEVVTELESCEGKTDMTFH